MDNLPFITSEELQRVSQASDGPKRLHLLADICRLNTLTAVKRAGSGHLGSSLSSLNIVIYLYFERMNTLSLAQDDPGRDIFFSSKGHDVPALYSVLFGAGIIPRERLLRLRRLGGLDGHPDVKIPGIEANSGSLGMGISKGKGMAWAKRSRGWGGHVYVMTGDGEFQEGQNYEALQSAANHEIGGLTVIMDHNKVQTDKRISDIINLRSLDDKFASFGWDVARIDGHDFDALARALGPERAGTGKPMIVIADTIKGHGVSFMEHPGALDPETGLYPWHAGAPTDEDNERGSREIIERIQQRCIDLGISAPAVENVPAKVVDETGAEESLEGEQLSVRPTKVSDEYVADAYGDRLVEHVARNDQIAVLDADLSADCRIRGVEDGYPAQFIENGIAEQDMVSTAGGLARMGYLPVVNSFGTFLAARSNEQIYNNAGEGGRIIYVCHYAGMIPAGPGKSHQSIRDISLFGALPNLEILQPCNAGETRQVLDYCIDSAPGSTMIRLIIGPSPRKTELPDDYTLRPGRGVALTEGTDAVMIAYGPVMLHEALSASEALAEHGFGLKVVNMPWLNRIDAEWLEETLGETRDVYFLEDHSPVGGLGDRGISVLAHADRTAGRRLRVLGVEGLPACGTPTEALQAHERDARSLARLVLEGTASD